MDLQTTFYIIGIIFMVLAIALLIGIAVMLIIVMKRVNDAKRQVEATVAGLTSKPAQILAKIGIGVITSFLRRHRR